MRKAAKGREHPYHRIQRSLPFKKNQGSCKRLACLQKHHNDESSIPTKLTANKPPINRTRVVVGTIAGGVLLVDGVSTFAIGVGLFFEDPPARAFIAGAGVVLTVLSAEVLYQAWRPALPNSWPDHIIINPLSK